MVISSANRSFITTVRAQNVCFPTCLYVYSSIFVISFLSFVLKILLDLSSMCSRFELSSKKKGKKAYDIDFECTYIFLPSYDAENAPTATIQ